MANRGIVSLKHWNIKSWLILGTYSFFLAAYSFSFCYAFVEAVESFGLSASIFKLVYFWITIFVFPFFSLHWGIMFRCDNWELAILHFHVYPHIYLASPEHCCLRHHLWSWSFFSFLWGWGGGGGGGRVNSF